MPISGKSLSTNHINHEELLWIARQVLFGMAD